MGEFLPATQGAGPLLQRDYWAIFKDCALTPKDVIVRVKTHFCAQPPAALISCSARDGLRPGATLDIVITPGQHCAVRLVHESPQSLTLATLNGHPEAGRITFGCYRNAARDVIFHIRSRARSTDALERIGFLAIGDAMQTTRVDLLGSSSSPATTSAGGTVTPTSGCPCCRITDRRADRVPMPQG